MMKEEGGRKRVKVRKSWIRNPVEKVVVDKDVDDDFNPRQLKDEALEEHEKSKEKETER